MNVETADHSSDARLIVLGSLLYTAGSAILYVLPAYLGELSSQLGLNEAQLGTISGAENIGVALASIVSMLWLARVNQRLVVVVGVVLCAALNLVAFFGRSVHGLVLCRFLTGLLGEGLLFAMAFRVLGATRDPDRSFGIGLTTVVGFGSLVLACSPYLDRVPRGAGALVPLALVPLTVLFALKWMPGSWPGGAAPALSSLTTATTGRATNGRATRHAGIAILGMTVWFAAPGAFWTFAESAAAARKVPIEIISAALAIGNALGLLGSVIAAWQGDRWGRSRPIMAATGCLCLSVVAFQQCAGVLGLAAALSGFNIAWNYAAVYEMALVVAVDPTGRAPLAISAAQVMGFAAGGFLSGIAILHTGYGALPAAVSLLAVGGLVMFTPCFRHLRLEPHRG